MEMRLYDGKEYFTRSVSDLLTKMPEPPVKKRKTTRALDQQPSSITQIDEQVDDGGSKPYMCAITPDGLGFRVANFILSVILITILFYFQKLLRLTPILFAQWFCVKLMKRGSSARRKDWN